MAKRGGSSWGRTLARLALVAALSLVLWAGAAAAPFVLAHLVVLRGASARLAAAAAVAALLNRWDAVLGLLSFGRAPKNAPLPEAVQTLLTARAAARQARDWTESDRLRDALQALGWAVRDTPAGQTCQPS